jgi:hypothetical protein
MPIQDFVEQLRALGFSVTDHGEGRISFPYTVESGKFADQVITIGFIIPPDYNLSPPTGPHLKPRLLPINATAGDHPLCGVHESSQFGPEWEYWSRPMNHWNQTQKHVDDVMAHLRRLFDTQ